MHPIVPAVRPSAVVLPKERDAPIRRPLRHADCRIVRHASEEEEMLLHVSRGMARDGDHADSAATLSAIASIDATFLQAMFAGSPIAVDARG